MHRLYDLMLLLDPEAPEDRRAGAVSEVESLIGGSGELVATQEWGSRRLAYEIDHRVDAEYRLYQFRGGNELLERLGQRLRISDGVLRFRIVRVREGQPAPLPPEQHRAGQGEEEQEAPETRVAARAAADAPADEEEEEEGAE